MKLKHAGPWSKDYIILKVVISSLGFYLVSLQHLPIN